MDYFKEAKRIVNLKSVEDKVSAIIKYRHDLSEEEIYRFVRSSGFNRVQIYNLIKK